MEFLNGLKAQPLELLVGKVCQKKEGGCSLYKLLLLECEYACVRKCVCVSSFLAESEALRQKAQDTGPWQSVSHSFVYGDTPLPRLGPCNSLWLLTRSFCQEVVLCCQSEMWLM